MNQMVGACDRCGRRKPLFAVDSGELRQEYLCEWCSKRSLRQRPDHGDDGGETPPR